jgi:hypothetical protein
MDAVMDVAVPRDNLTEDQRAILASDRVRWQRMAAGAHLDDWLSFGPGQLIRRSQAMQRTGTNKPEGRAYNEEMAALLKEHGLHTADTKQLTAVLWLHSDPERLAVLDEIRSALTDGQCSRLNTPTAAQQRVRQLLRPGADKIEARNKRRYPQRSKPSSTLDHFRNDSVEDLSAEMIKTDTKKAQRLAFNILKSLNVTMKSAG